METRAATAARLSIFDYQSVRPYLLDQVNERRQTVPKFSLRSWAREMGFSHHVSLVLVLKGQRKVSQKMVPFLSKGLTLSMPETQYLQGLVMLENARDEDEVRALKPWLATLNPGNRYLVKEVNEQKVVSDWIHSAIYVETFSRSGLRDIETVARKYAGRMPSSEVFAAFERLKSQGILYWSGEKKRWLTDFSRVTTRDDVPNQAVRKYHRDVATLAIESLESQPVDEREFNSFAFCIDPSTVEPLKQLMRKFRTDVEALLRASAPGDVTYQMNLQMFRLQDEPAPKNSRKIPRTKK